MTSTRSLLLSLAALLLLPAAAPAQDAWPSRPLRMVAPFPPGGTTDVLARIIAQRLSDALGRQVLVENRPGVGGNLGNEFAARLPPDGYNILLSSSAQLVTNVHLYKRLGFDPLNDFSPVSQVASSGQVLVVHPSIPVKTVQQLVAIARAKPGSLNFGSGGRGTPAHVAGEVFQVATGTKLVHVPYKGGGLAVVDLVAGQIDMVLSDMAPAVPQVKAGKLRALAVTSERRSPALPDVPTLAEAGIKGSIRDVWWVLMTPRGTAPAVVARLNAEIGAMMKNPELQERFAQLGITPLHSTPEHVTELIRLETPAIGKALKAAGIEPE
ncbi:MAG: tripartite tricarboxylate transporter substrate binding protein [Rhodocyclaceae bacterium]|nr:tripartite tricarboxylate transporter substrate binding protein [Rhodocyclaceae bacterium]MCA3074411.1 tripartite tricarboxylate transporter substrate binding protein [Rhodocyclaceae bacterium]MCA3090818.1 tripartite tricarboxylate transporter substrate binding protein [Rhodocyclaceae bacterium]MCA3095503.1 tripartite tricarboxylate transporter substrate binding protein [Rhodocyclaceae bacterium]MCA3097510.1 tripartite tricarboxylate transporter substrate binding protein [Rhodocyclaceae bact